MRAVPQHGDQPTPGTEEFLVYVQRFDIVTQFNPSRNIKGPFPDPTTKMYSVKRARRSDKSLLGDIVPLRQLRDLIDLYPRLGKIADPRLTRANILEYGTEFWVNKYFTKEMFFALK